MSEPQRYNGIMLGMLQGPNGEAAIGISIAGGKTLVISIPSAGELFSQLGDMLESVGYFEQACDCPNCSKEPDDKTTLH